MKHFLPKNVALQFRARPAKKLAQFLEMSEEKAFLGIAPEIKNDLKVGN